MTMYNQTILRDNALKYGLSPTDIANILEKFGPAVLELIIDGLKDGLTFSFLQEILAKLGPLFLQLAVTKHETDKLKSTGTYVVCVPTGEVESAFKHMDEPHTPPKLDLLYLLKKILPMLIKEYGQQVIEAIIEAILTGLKNKPIHLNEALKCTSTT